MSFDNSRATFNPWNDYSGVVMQQGRVQTDADWNEWLAELSRRIQAGTLDTMGHAVYPATTPYAFQIAATGGPNTINIGVGRMYVDGLLVENHGDPTTAAWDPALDEISNAPQPPPSPPQPLGSSNSIPFANQHYAVGATVPAGNGTYLAYLDVWRRPITYIEDPSLVDVAIGVETTGRLQTAWQVGLLPMPTSTIPGSVTSGTFTAWEQVTQTSSGATANLVGTVPAPGPMTVGPITGTADASDTWVGQTSGAVFTPMGPPVADYSTIAGVVSSGTFIAGEQLIQSNSGASANLIGPVAGSGPMYIGPITGTADATDTWVGQTSGAVFTPTAAPVVSTWSCATPDSAIPWPVTSGYLSNNTVTSGPSGPCCLTTGTGYTGVENQFYRVEIHQPGTSGGANATFKWSRENASVQTTVTGIASGSNSLGDPASVLTVLSLGRDQVLGFLPGNWIEITNQTLDDNCQPGELYKIDSVDPASTTITLTSLLSSNFPASSLQSNAYTRIIRWDQSGKIYKSDNSPYYDLDAQSSSTITGSVTSGAFVASEQVTQNNTQASATLIGTVPASGPMVVGPITGSPDATDIWVGQTSGAQFTPTAGPDTSLDGANGIPVPTDGSWLILENGITVQFGLSVATGVYLAMNYWNFAARTADGKIDPLVNAPPRGIYHHYTKLSIVTFGATATATDCRVPWPPSSGTSGCCECTVVVQPSDLTGGTTLQSILNQYENLVARVTICLMPGTYDLASPLRFSSAHQNITLEASQEGYTSQQTVIIQAQSGQEGQFADGMVVLDNALNVAIRGIYFAVPLTNFQPPNGVFAGVPLSDLPPDVEVAINNLVVSIGVRPVNCQGLVIEDCEFGFQDFQEDIANSNAVPFGVGIFATGQCSDWRIVDNTFAGVGPFLAGVLLAPSVSLNQPPSSLAPRRKVAVAPRVVGAAASRNVVEGANLGTIGVGTVGVRAGGIGPIGSIFAGGSPTATAANGGTVLQSSLDEAVFKGNSFETLTIAALAVGGLGNVQFSDNQVDSCTAGFWSVAPMAAWWAILADSQNLALQALAIAMGYPLPQNDSTPAGQFVTIPAAPSSTLIYAGTSNYTDSQGNLWVPDSQAGAGVTITGSTGQYGPVTNSISNTQDPTLYQSERYGNSFSYTFNNLPMGFYQVTLKFAEIFYIPGGPTGTRIFNVSINGTQVLTDFNIVADAGGADIADDQTFPNVVPNAQGQIVVQFNGTSLGSDQNAKISAAAVVPQWNGSWPAPSASLYSSETVSFYIQLTELVQQALAISPSQPTARLRADGNQMQGLSSVGLLVIGSDLTPTAGPSALVVSGNRIETSFGSYQDFAIARTLSTTAQSTSFKASAVTTEETGEIAGYAAVILFINCCLMTGNLILNSGGEDNEGASLLYVGVFDLTQNQLPELMVSANVCQGRMSILPERLVYPGFANVPFPMNTWEFLNTVSY